MSLGFKLGQCNKDWDAENESFQDKGRLYNYTLCEVKMIVDSFPDP